MPETTGPEDPTTGAAECPPPAAGCEDGVDPVRAIGLDCPGTPLLAAPVLASADLRAVRVVRQLGNAAWVAREGAYLLALTTGVLPYPDANGNVARAPGAARGPEGQNDNPDFQDLPAPLVAASGSDGAPYKGCDGVGDCSETLPEAWQGQAANDLVWLDVTAAAPAGARSFALDIAVLTAEFPERAVNPLIDLVVVWVASEEFTGNLAAFEGAAFGAYGLRERILAGGIVGEEPRLVGTGFDGLRGQPCDVGFVAYADCPVGGASGWMTLQGPARAGEAVRVTVALWDVYDQQIDTLALLDAWRWRCEPCTLGFDCAAAPSG